MALIVRRAVSNDANEASGASPTLAHGERVVAGQLGDGFVEFARPEPVVRWPQGILVCGTQQVRVKHVGVGRIDHRWLRHSIEQVARVASHPLVELVFAAHQHGHGGVSPAASAAYLLVKRCHGAGEASAHHGVE